MGVRPYPRARRSRPPPRDPSVPTGRTGRLRMCETRHPAQCPPILRVRPRPKRHLHRSPKGFRRRCLRSSSLRPRHLRPRHLLRARPWLHRHRRRRRRRPRQPARPRRQRPRRRQRQPTTPTRMAMACPMRMTSVRLCRPGRCPIRFVQAALWFHRTGRRSKMSGPQRPMCPRMRRTAVLLG